ncbi:MAG: serine/threonine protein kinase [Proteobacteria bacterium]|nr:serine/threonine protein kinase [Pseudomonadota bacterium]
MSDFNAQTTPAHSNISQGLSEKAPTRKLLAEIPEVLKNKYEYIEKIGKGSQGQVWLAIRKTDGEKVAIKHLNIHSVTTWKQYELFRREAEILASMDCKGVVPFYEYIEDLDTKPPHVCIIQKYIEGQTLAEMLNSKHRFNAETIYDIIAQVLKILQNLHTHTPPVIHRDIKPSNLILTSADNGSYQVTLIDFGAVANPQVQTGGSTVAGTFGYMPPEQLMGQVVPGSDIYALGALAVQMLSGVSPADIEISGFKLMIEPYLEHVPNHIVQALTQMLEPVLKNRLCDYNALIALFKAQSQNQTPSFIKSLYKYGTTDFKDINYLCQDGSYEVWQNLDIYNLPEAIKFWNGKNQTVEHISVLLNVSDEIKDLNIIRPPEIAYANSRDTNGKVELFGNSKSILALFYIFSFLAVFISLVGGISLILTICIVILLSLIFFLFRFFTQTSLLEASSALRLIKLNKGTSQTHLKYEYIQTLKQGVKAVGRIIDIVYQSAQNNDIEIIDIMPVTDNEFIHATGNHLLSPKFFVHHPPRFIISYQFQINGKSLQGQLVTSTSPEEHYKIGDLLTLVVNMDIGKPDKFISVPYPYPLDDMTFPDDIIYEGDC